MHKLNRVILIFAIANAIMILTPAFLTGQFPPYPLIKYGDLFDVLTPLVLIPLYWLLFRLNRDAPPTQRALMAFLILAALYAQGQGMHLSANSIGHLMKDLKSTSAYALTEFYDEGLSHYLWHSGALALSALLMWRQWRYPFEESATLASVALAAFLFGAVHFIATVEAGTTPIGVPFALGVALFGLWRRRELGTRPLMMFFVAAYLSATLLFLAWGIYWRGLPQFSEVGIIE